MLARTISSAAAEVALISTSRARASLVDLPAAIIPHRDAHEEQGMKLLTGSGECGEGIDSGCLHSLIHCNWPAIGSIHKFAYVNK